MFAALFQGAVLCPAQAVGKGEQGCLGAVLKLELIQEVADVFFNGVFADIKLWAMALLLSPSARAWRISISLLVNMLRGLFSLLIMLSMTSGS